jgi:hypothetical protein
MVQWCHLLFPLLVRIPLGTVLPVVPTESLPDDILAGAGLSQRPRVYSDGENGETAQMTDEFVLDGLSTT